jgi:hypothetical protein
MLKKLCRFLFTADLSVPYDKRHFRRPEIGLAEDQLAPLELQEIHEVVPYSAVILL